MFKILISIFLLLFLFIIDARSQEYHGCFGSGDQQQKTIWLSTDGFCLMPDVCKQLQNCTTFYGNLIFRSTIDEASGSSIGVKPHFPYLREITGFLAITFYNQATFELLPELSVIRGTNLIGNYALVVYFNEITGIYFPSLTTILHGGVRIDRNSKLCYADTVKWKSIVKDRDQEEKFGIVLSSNNLNCDSSCVKGQCYAAPGHSDNPNAQFCWGAGYSTGDFQCQKFCDRQCGLEGCAENTIDSCCHEQCLGGCYAADSTYSCYACKHYRLHKTGECVETCPDKYYVVDDLICKPECPGWTDGSSKAQLLLNGRCVDRCPAGYLSDTATNTCLKCQNPLDCSRVCSLRGEVLDSDGGFYPGAIISLPSDIKTKGLYGCTEINGSLTFRLQEGTGNIDEVIDGLKWLRVVRGHIKIHKSSLKTMSFLENLELIDPPTDSLLLERYSLMIYENKPLEELWVAKNRIRVTQGKIFAQYNPRLCPNLIHELQKQMYVKAQSDQVKGDISEQLNGNRVDCQVERLEISVEEVVFDPDNILSFFGMNIPLHCMSGKCSRVRWDFVRSATSRYLLFYTLYYLKLEHHHNTTQIQVVDDFGEDEKWKSIDIERPDTQDNLARKTPMDIIVKVTPYVHYAFYLKEIVSKGEGKTSKIKFLKISQGKPTAPVGMEASYLSKDSIHLRWKAPSSPNGKIVSYQIYWVKADYSFWAAQFSVDWCKRNVKIGAVKASKKKEVVPDGTCNKNFTCVCDGDKEKLKVLKADKEEALFMAEFQDRINKVIFTKPKGKDDHNDKFNGISGGKGDPNTSKAPTTLENFTTMMTESTTTTPEPIMFDTPNANVSGDVLSFVVKNLTYFQDYTFKVCACTEEENGGSCATPETAIVATCASAQARTDFNPMADNLPGQVLVYVDGNSYNISWEPPAYPNAIILKYQISLRFQGSEDDLTLCHPGNMPTFISRTARPGDYIARVRALSPAGNGSWSEQVLFKIAEPSSGENTLILGVSIGAAVLILVLLAFVIYYAFFKRSVEKGAPGVLYASVNPEYMNSSEVYIPDEWELNREKIELLGELGQGSFGMVYEGIAHDIAGVAELRVAVKTVNENASIRDRIEFLQEASIMKAFNSNHVVKLIGVVSQGQPTFVVMELMGRGDLKTFLRSRRPEEKSHLLPPMREETLQMAAEIADGMAYLAARKFVHRDLAARNCMVAIDFTVKIGDFGMARDIYETDYYRKGGKGLLPVRWMAPESLRDGIFTTASDVWSYGVVLWEMSTLASQPYQGKSNEEVLHFVLNDGHLIYPDDADKQIKQFMELCWSRDPKLRPSFLEIIRLLEEHVSEDFMEDSFYHEMKRKALEDTQCQEHNLLDLLDRPYHRKGNDVDSLKGKSSTLSLTSSVDSGTYIENSKPEADQTPQLIHARKSLYMEDDVPQEEEEEEQQQQQQQYVPPSPVERNCKSVYDNYGTISDNMKYGDTPVHKSVADGGNRDGDNDLKLSKIFSGKGFAI